MMKMTKSLTLLLLVALLGSLLLGCSTLAEKATKKAIEKGTGVSVDEDGKKVKIEGDKGSIEIETEQNKLPDGFPSDFPVYKGAIVKSSSKTDVDQQKFIVVALETDDSFNNVVAYYKEQLPKSGYSISSTTELGQLTTFILKQEGEKNASSVTIQSQNDKTAILISLYVE